MLRSMYSAVSGLRNHQTMLDVVGNNIANVNTFGFKTGRTVFEDNLSQVIRGASAANQNATIGGTNPAQVGLGVRLGAITNVFTQGSLQVTNQTTDLAIQGDGFFTVQQDGQTLYTRSGAFNFDSEGYLVTSGGSFVMGYVPDLTTTPPTMGTTLEKLRLPSKLAADGAPGWAAMVGGTDATLGTSDDISLLSFTIGTDGKISGSFSDNVIRDFGEVALTNFNNPMGLEKVGNSMYRETNNSGAPQTGDPSEEGRGSIQSGTLEMSNVDLAQEFTQLIVAQRGFQANSKVVSTSDEILNDLIQMKR